MTQPITPTEAELLAALGPLAGIVDDTIRSVPVRLGPGGTSDLTDTLTLAVALYCARNVVPADALQATAGLRQPPHTTTRKWWVETRRNADDEWNRFGPSWDDQAQAQDDFQRTVAAAAHRLHHQTREYRLVRGTTTYALEAEHRPDPEEQP